jgi:hypothetical protein
MLYEMIRLRMRIQNINRAYVLNSELICGKQRSQKQPHPSQGRNARSRHSKPSCNSHYLNLCNILTFSPSSLANKAPCRTQQPFHISRREDPFCTSSRHSLNPRRHSNRNPPPLLPKSRTLAPSPPKSILPINGYIIPARTTISTSSYTLHRNESVFPSPEVWKPERWLEASSEQRAGMMKWFWAFGSGTRMCIGSNLALLGK